MYYTSEVLPKSRYTHRELERYFWREVGRGEFVSYGSWLRHAIDEGIVIEHEESYTFDDFIEHLTVIVKYDRAAHFVDGHFVDFDDEVMYAGRVPSGKADWEKKWTRNPDPEYGEDGRLYYVGDGKWELVIWTAEKISDEEYYDGVRWEYEGSEYDFNDLKEIYEKADHEEHRHFKRWMHKLEDSGALKRLEK